MYLRKKDAEDLLKNHLDSLLQTLDFKQSYLENLQDQDDWAFVIKAQALIEDAVTHALLAHVGDQRLGRIVHAMPLVGKEVSKLALAKDLGALNPKQRRFINKLASLRNLLAHRHEHVAFSFDEFISSLNRSERKDWQESICWFEGKSSSIAIWYQLAIEQPKITIHMATFILVALLASDGLEKDFIRKIDEVSITTVREFLENPPNTD